MKLKKAFLVLCAFVLSCLTSYSQEKKNEKEESSQSPSRAALYSAIIPGAGQVYNKAYWKVPVVYAGIGMFGYFIWFNNKYYHEYRNAYRDFVVRDPNNTSYLKYVNNGWQNVDIYGSHEKEFESALKNKVDHYKRYRDLSYIGMATWYVLQIVEASVDAHFSQFSVNDDLTIKVNPYSKPINNKPNLGLQVWLTF